MNFEWVITDLIQILLPHPVDPEMIHHRQAFPSI